MARTPQSLVPAERLQRRSRGAVGFHPVTAEQVPESRATRLLGTLTKVLPAAAKEYEAALDKKIESDKLLQESRAALGQEPTNDATVAGAKAHELVDTRNAAVVYAYQLQEDAKTFEGTDEEWEQHVLDTQNTLMSTIGNDKDAITIAGSVFQKEFGKAALNRYKAKQEQHQTKLYQTNINSLHLATQGDFTPQEIRHNLSKVIDEMHLQGASEATIRKSIVDAAITQSELNDLTLIDYTKEMGLFQQEPGLARAERQAQTRITGQVSGEIAIAKQSAIDRMVADDNMTFEQWAMYAGTIKEPTGKSAFSESEIRSVWERQQKAKDDEFDASRYFAQSMKRMIDEQTTPVGFEYLDKKQTAAVIALYDQTFEQMEAKEIAQLQDPNQQAEVKQKYAYNKARWLTENGIQDEKWVNEFKALEAFSGELQEDKLPDGVAIALSRMDDLSESPGAIQAHATDKQIAIYEGFKKGLRVGLPAPQAYAEAWRNAQLKPVELRGDERKKFDKQVRKAVEADLDHNWLSRTFLGAPQAVSKQQSSQIQEAVGARARMLLNANVEPDVAVSRAMAEFNDTHFQLSNGAVVYGNRTNVSRIMGVAAGKVDGLITSFPQAIVDLASEPGYEDAVLNESIPPEKWIPVLTQNGRITFTDEWGNRVTRIFDLSEVGGVSLSEKAKKIQEQQDKLREKRLHDVEVRNRTINQFGIKASNWHINE
jgi:hypothetical protein